MEGSSCPGDESSVGITVNAHVLRKATMTAGMVILALLLQGCAPLWSLRLVGTLLYPWVFFKKTIRVRSNLRYRDSSEHWVNSGLVASFAQQLPPCQPTAPSHLLWADLPHWAACKLVSPAIYCLSPCSSKSAVTGGVWDWESKLIYFLWTLFLLKSRFSQLWAVRGQPFSCDVLGFQGHIFVGLHRLPVPLCNWLDIFLLLVITSR